MLLDFSKYSSSSDPLKKPTHKKKKSIKNISSVKDENFEELTSKDIQNSLSLRFINHNYLIYNAFIFNWESDFFSLSEAGYVYEVEIKVTRADFKDDFNKKDKHFLLESQISDNFTKKPNKFFYAAPKGLLLSKDIPEYAGLIEVSSRNSPAIVVKEAPFLHKEKIFDMYKESLFDKFYHRYRELLTEKMQKYDNQ